jgi:hypothetical protein
MYRYSAISRSDRELGATDQVIAPAYWIVAGIVTHVVIDTAQEPADAQQGYSGPFVDS